MFDVSEPYEPRPVELLGVRRAFLRTFVLVAILVIAGCGQSHGQLRILTYNIHHGEGTDGRFDLARIAGVINGQRPDLVALQEVDRRTTRASGVDQAAEARIQAVIQPGGSRRDDEVITACNEHGIAMIFTGRRHFKH